MDRRLLALAAAPGLALAAPAADGAAPKTVLHISSHLSKTARASLDGGKPVRAPGYASTNSPFAVSNTASNIVGVSRPVFVFSREQW